MLAETWHNSTKQIKKIVEELLFYAVHQWPVTYQWHLWVWNVGVRVGADVAQ
jgi:hypothetical protein